MGIHARGRRRTAGRLRGPALAGAALCLCAGRALDPAGLNRTWLLLGGALYGVLLALCLRWVGLPTRSWPLVGALLAPLVPALWLDERWGVGERVGLLLAAALLGTAVGALERARIRDGGGPS